MAWHYWGNKEIVESRNKALFDLCEEPRIGPDDGCWHCVHNDCNVVCRLTGYNIVHQTGPACARFIERK